MSGSNSNPGWALNFQPTPSQWAAAFSGKVDQTNGIMSAGTIAGGSITNAIITGGTITGTVATAGLGFNGQLTVYGLLNAGTVATADLAVTGGNATLTSVTAVTAALTVANIGTAAIAGGNATLTSLNVGTVAIAGGSATLGTVAIGSGNATLSSLNSGSVTATGTISAGGTMLVTGPSTPMEMIAGSNGAVYFVDQYGFAGYGFDANGNLYTQGTAVVESGLALSAAGISGTGFTLSTSGLSAASSSGTLAVVAGVAAGLAFVDSFGFAGGMIDANFNIITTGSTVSGQWGTLSPTGISGPAAANILQLATAAVTGLTGLLIVDSLGFAGAVIDPTGSFLTQPNPAPLPTTYAAQDITNLDILNLGMAQVARGETDFFAQRPAFGYNHILSAGQSDAQGDQAIALSTTQPCDNVMLGGSPRSASNTAWSPVGGANVLNPLIAVNNGTYRTGAMTSMGTVTVTIGSSSAGTIAQTGATPMSSVFQAGDVIGASGWTGGAVANNNGNGSGMTGGGNTISQFWTVTTVGSSSLTYTNNSSVFTPVAASQASGVSLQIVQFNPVGECPDVESTNLYRKLSLANKQLAADPTRILIDTNCCVPGESIATFRNLATASVAALAIRQSGTTDPIPSISTQGFSNVAVPSINQGATNFVLGTDYSVTSGNPAGVNWITSGPTIGSTYTIDYTFSPSGFFSQYSGAATAIKALATTAGKTSGLSIATLAQGGTDAQGGNGSATTYASYTANLTGWFEDVIAMAGSIYGQSAPPLFLVTQVASLNTSDVGYPLTIQQAQYDLCVTNPPVSSVYLLPGHYAMPSFGIHLSGNGYRWWGAIVAKVINRIFERGERWRPLAMISATYRGSTILVGFHVPYPPIQSQPVFFFMTPGTFADLGFTVLSSTGARNPIVSATIAGDTVVEITCAGTISAGSTIRYGDTTYHSGAGNICDSDPAVSDVNWVYSQTSGQLPCENVAGYAGNPFPLWNWCCLGSLTLVSA